MRQLYWFQTDLRLEDNPGLLEHLDAEQLLLVYLWPRQRPWCNQHGIGEQRARFLAQSLTALRAQLQALGQDLLVIDGSPELVIPDLVARFGIGRVGTSRTPGWYEARAIRTLRDKLAVPLQVHRGNTLFAERALPFALEALPAHYTPFRKALAGCAPDAPLAAPTALPPPPAVGFHPVRHGQHRPHPGLPLEGGSVAGQRRLAQFVSAGSAVESYRLTRNALDPLGGSSTLSPWLANGCLSVRAVAAQLQRLDAESPEPVGLGGVEAPPAAAGEAAASRDWLYRELLWREFFHWHALADPAALFRFHGPRGRPAARRIRHCTFEPRNFARWCQGDTNFPLVNALMHQLVATGWMSNRGRQIAASCLVNEYGIDWRYGAAFFERHLIDYEVGSNYGNWQYIAGVGADPRGGRHFNIEKQSEEHDPDGVFTAKWDGYRPHQPDHVVDAADWPC